jgi:hypothetical protein
MRESIDGIDNMPRLLSLGWATTSQISNPHASIVNHLALPGSQIGGIRPKAVGGGQKEVTVRHAAERAEGVG